MEISKSFADLRIKLGDKKKDDDIEKETIPSDIDDDEWAEIQRYEQEKYQEEKRRENE